MAVTTGPAAHGSIAAGDHPALVAPTTQQPYVILLSFSYSMFTSMPFYSILVTMERLRLDTTMP